MWRYHTRTWIDSHNTFHQEVSIGLGWYLALLGLFMIVSAGFWIAGDHV
jgi:hypothetical protein